MSYIKQSESGLVINHPARSHARRKTKTVVQQLTTASHMSLKCLKMIENY